MMQMRFHPNSTTVTSFLLSIVFLVAASKARANPDLERLRTTGDCANATFKASTSMARS
jgi:hypothetical protein